VVKQAFMLNLATKNLFRKCHFLSITGKRLMQEVPEGSG